MRREFLQTVTVIFFSIVFKWYTVKVGLVRMCTNLTELLMSSNIQGDPCSPLKQTMRESMRKLNLYVLSFYTFLSQARSISSTGGHDLVARVRLVPMALNP